MGITGFDGDLASLITLYPWVNRIDVYFNHYKMT
jgi:hypothetical protein